MRKVKALRRKVPLEIHRSNIFVWGYPVELINRDSTSQRNKTLAGWKKVQSPEVLVVENLPEGIMISEYAQSQILAL